MSSSSLNDTAMTSSSGVKRDVNQVLRLTGAKANPRYFGFRWKQRNQDDTGTSGSVDVKDLSAENLSNSKISNGFLKNIKKRLHIKNLRLCKVKQKLIGIDLQRDSMDSGASFNEEKTSSFRDEKCPIEANERLPGANSEVSLSGEQITSNDEADVCWESYSLLERRRQDDDESSKKNASSRELRLESGSHDERNDLDAEHEDVPSVARSSNVAEPQSTTAKESVETVDGVIDAQISIENKAKVNLSEELLKLSKYGWYWGPISGDEADSKLVSEPDGAFLVRDSSDDRYLLTLSFKSSGRLLHARMEHSGGLFSLCNQGDNEGFTSVPALIDHSMNSSQSAVFCYSRPKYPGYPSFPVRLTKPVSRFTQVRSLQYLCRFVIRQNTRLDNIHKLPLPKTIRGYIEEAHY